VEPRIAIPGSFNSARPARSTAGRIFRVVWIALATLVLAVGIVLVIGLLLPTAHVATRSAVYAAPPERLFALIDGPQNWRHDVVQSKAVRDPAGRELWIETTRDGMTITYALEQRTAPTSIVRRIVTENLPYGGAWTYSLSPDGTGTRVRITENGKVYNPIFRFAARFMIGYYGSMDSYLRALGHATGQDVQPDA
jgi:hypothetical protein